MLFGGNLGIKTVFPEFEVFPESDVFPDPISPVLFPLPQMLPIPST